MWVDRVNRAARRVPVWAVYLAGLVPLGVLVAAVVGNDLGPDPVPRIEHRLGIVGLQLILAGLVISPLRWSLGINLIRFRRAIGLLAFAYVTLHLLTWVTLDMGLRWSQIAADLWKRPYILIGMAGFLAMVPLAVTSNAWSIRRLGAATWQRLHQLTYLVALLGAVHFMVLVKAWPLEPMVYLAAAVGLVGWRVVRKVGRRVANA